jgi:hypothetical protein
MYDIDSSEQTRLVILAARANGRGPKPLNETDKLRTAKMIYEDGGGVEDVAYALQCHTKLARDYHRRAAKEVGVERVNKAIFLVRAGMTVPQAAREAETTTAKVNAALTRKTRQNVEEHRNGVKIDISRKFTGLSRKIGATFPRVFDEFKDGELKERQVRAMLAGVRKGVMKATAQIEDLEARFEVLAASLKKKK